jgi:hypothetical protein
MTSFGDKWLGDESLSPVMEELDGRKAIVDTHQTQVLSLYLAPYLEHESGLYSASAHRS